MNKSNGNEAFFNTNATSGSFIKGQQPYNCKKTMYNDGKRHYFYDKTDPDIPSNLVKGRLPVRDRTRKLLSEKLTGKPKSQEFREYKRMSQIGDKNHRWGKTHSEESKEKMRKAQQGKLKPKVICEICGATIIKTNYIRWHGNKCKDRR